MSSVTTTASFSVTKWEETPYDEPAEGARLSETNVEKTFDGAVTDQGEEDRLFGYIVPGSGTGALMGMSGSIEISRTPEGQHILTVHYSFAGATSNPT